MTQMMESQATDQPQQPVGYGGIRRCRQVLFLARAPDEPQRFCNAQQCPGHQAGRYAWLQVVQYNVIWIHYLHSK